MRPEDIDKVFKERLGNSAPIPPADMWARLQERMEQEEKPMMAIVPEKETAPKPADNSRRFMWLYSSVAATLSLLLAVSVVFYNINTGTPEINEALTRHDNKLMQEQPVVEPASEPEQAIAAEQEPVTAEAEAVAEVEEKEKNITPQATAEATPASTITKAPVKAATLAKTSPEPVQQHKKAGTLVNRIIEKADGQQALAATTTPDKPAPAEQAEASFTSKAAKPTALAVAESKANLNAEPVEIIIKRSVSSQTAMAEENTTPDASGKKVKLAKNIFKQVRNLASGEEVELSALGIRADRVALETQIGKQKISKVINL